MQAVSSPLLALDTSTGVGGVAVGTADRVLAEVTVGVRARGSDTLLPAIDYALRAAGVARGALAGIVVAGGPGSFTGVRIAGAAAKALARALAVPLYAYSSLLALAAGVAATPRPVCALFDARRGEVYAGCWRFAPAGAELLLEPGVGALEDVLARVGSFEPVYAGEGATRFQAVIRAAGGEVAAPHLGLPRAAALLWLAAVDPAGGRVHDVAGWEPAYLRAPGAERGVVG